MLYLHVQFPESDSLKAKRHRLKPLLIRLHKEFNVSAAEVDFQEKWQDALIGCALVSNSAAQAERSLHKISTWVERNWHDADLVGDQIEIIP